MAIKLQSKALINKLDKNENKHVLKHENHAIIDPKCLYEILKVYIDHLKYIESSMASNVQVGVNTFVFLDSFETLTNKNKLKIKNIKDNNTKDISQYSAKELKEVINSSLEFIKSNKYKYYEQQSKRLLLLAEKM